MAPAVPSFGSFQPLAAPAEAEGSDASTEVKERRHRSRSSSSRRRLPRADQETSKRPSAVERPKEGTDNDTPPPLFVLDRFGDTEAARYGASKHTVASFQRAAPNVALGLSGKVRTPHRAARRRHAPPAVPRTHERLTVEPKNEGFQEEVPYVALDDPREAHAPVHPRYRDPYQTESAPASDEPEKALFSHDSPQEQSRLLHARITKNASDVDAWISLAQLQRRLLGDTPSTSASSTEATIARMQLAVLDKAQAASAQNATKLPLQLTRLHTIGTAGLWPSDKVERAWRTVLDSYAGASDATVSGTAEVWWAYVQFRQGDWATFTYDATVEVYTEAIEAVSMTARWEGADLVQVHTHQLSFLAAFCAFARSAGTSAQLTTGYVERAWALMQATLELQLGVYENGAGRDPTLFGQWWDAGHGRIGDAAPAYQGFSLEHKPAELRDTLPIYLDTTKAARSAPPTRDAMAQWQHGELDATEKAQPQRVLDATPEGDPADPFAYVFYADLQPLLPLPFLHDEAAVIRVADTVLAFVGLPTNWLAPCLYLDTPGAHPADDCTGVPAVSPTASSLHTLARVCTPAAGAESTGEVHRLPPVPAALLPQSHDDPRGVWYAAMATLDANVAAQAERILVHLASRLSNTPSCSVRPKLAIPHALLCLATDRPASARKVLRAGLHKDDQCAILWYVYAQLELREGKEGSARKVLVQVLSSLRTPAREGQGHVAVLLWTLWIEWMWASGRVDACQRLLSAAAAFQFGYAPTTSALLARIGGEEPAPLLATERLQCLHTIRKAHASLLARLPTSVDMVPCMTYCLALAELLMHSVPSGDELVKPTMVFRQTLVQLGEQSWARKATGHLWERSLYLYQRTQPAYRPRDLRAITTQLVEQFPTDASHLARLVVEEQHARWQDHVRQTMEKYVLRHGQVGSWLELARGETPLAHAALDAEVSWLLALAMEQRVATHLDRTRMRRLVDRALEAMRYAPRLWHMALQLERCLLASTADGKGSKLRKERAASVARAKTLVYQAIRHCPYDKGTYAALTQHSTCLPLIHCCVKDSTTTNCTHSRPRSRRNSCACFLTWRSQRTHPPATRLRPTTPPRHGLPRLSTTPPPPPPLARWYVRCGESGGKFPANQRRRRK